MNVFLVLTQYGNGLQDECLFATAQAAFAYSKRRKHAGKSEILEISVIGDVDEMCAVYTISWNNRTRDTHNFEGVYGNYRHAKEAVGNYGTVLRRLIHENFSESITQPQHQPVQRVIHNNTESAFATLVR